RGAAAAAEATARARTVPWQNLSSGRAQRVQRKPPRGRDALVIDPAGVDVQAPREPVELSPAANEKCRGGGFSDGRCSSQHSDLGAPANRTCSPRIDDVADGA